MCSDYPVRYILNTRTHIRDIYLFRHRRVHMCVHDRKNSFSRCTELQCVCTTVTTYNIETVVLRRKNRASAYDNFCAGASGKRFKYMDKNINNNKKSIKIRQYELLLLSLYIYTGILFCASSQTRLDFVFYVSRYISVRRACERRRTYATKYRTTRYITHRRPCIHARAIMLSSGKLVSRNYA